MNSFSRPDLLSLGTGDSRLCLEENPTKFTSISSPGLHLSSFAPWEGLSKATAEKPMRATFIQGISRPDICSQASTLPLFWNWMDQWNLLLKEPIEVNGHWEEVSATSLKVSTPDQISIGALTDFCMIQRGHPRWRNRAHKVGVSGYTPEIVSWPLTLLAQPSKFF